MAANTQKNTRKKVGAERAAHLEKYRWKPGMPSPNPNGRPRKLTDELNRILDLKVPRNLDKQGRRYFEVFVKSVLERTIKKSDVLAKEVFDRIEGKQGFSKEEHRKPTVQVIVLDCPRPDRSKIVNVNGRENNGNGSCSTPTNEEK